MLIEIPKLIAHRGLSAFAPENTLTAFKLAAEKGYEMFECDVQLSQDGIPIIFHDDTLSRTTRRNGHVADQTYADLNGLGINSLVEVLEWLTGNTMKMNLEFKGRQPYLVESVIAALKPYLPTLQNRLLVSSFELENLEAVQAYHLQVSLGVLIDVDLFRVLGLNGVRERVQTLNAQTLNIDIELLQIESLRRFLTICPHVLVYTVEYAKAQNLIDQGVTAVFTNG